MVSRLLGLALGVILASQVGAQQADNKKLRELIDLPETFFKFGAGLDAAGTVWIDGDVFDVPGDIAALEKALRGDDSDLERYCKLSLLYTDEAKRKQAAARAVELAHGQLQRTGQSPLRHADGRSSVGLRARGRGGETLSSGRAARSRRRRLPAGAASYAKAACLAIQGKTDAAFESLGKALELGWKDFQFMAADRSLDSLRNDPRYDDLLKKYVK